MYLIRIKVFVFLLILSTATAPSFKKIFGRCCSSKHAAKHEDANEGIDVPAGETDDATASRSRFVKKLIGRCCTSKQTEKNEDANEGKDEPAGETDDGGGSSPHEAKHEDANEGKDGPAGETDEGGGSSPHEAKHEDANEGKDGPAGETDEGGGSSQHEAKHEDANEGKDEPPRETDDGVSSLQHEAKNENVNEEKDGSAGETDDGNTSLYSTNHSMEHQENSYHEATCKSQLISEGYYENVIDNWIKARAIKLDKGGLSHFANEQYDRFFGVSTACGRIYTEILWDVYDINSDAFKQLKGVTDFCATNSICVTQIPGIINYYEDYDNQYNYY